MNDIQIVQNEENTTLVEINALEKKYNITLPLDYKAFLLKNNGGHPVKNTFSLLEDKVVHSSDIAWFFALYNGYDENLEKEIIKCRTVKLFDTNLIPIARDSGGSFICLNINIHNNDYGKIYFCDNSSASYGNKYLVANAFEDFIKNLH